VDAVASADEARVALAKPYDVVLADLGCRRGAPELMRATRARADGAAGYAQLSDAVRQSGCRAHVLKPVRQAPLVRSLRAILDVAAPDTQALPLHAAGCAPARAERLLVVDDVAVNQRLMLAILDKRGSPRTWPARARGRRGVRAAHYDLVLMDCHMPEMDGFEARSHPRRR